MNAISDNPAPSAAPTLSRRRGLLTALVRALAAGAAGAAVFFVLVEILLRWTLPPYFGRIPFDRDLRFAGPDDSREHAASAGVTNALRIAVVGDSISMGVGNQRYAVFGYALESLLNVNRGVPPVRVDIYAHPSATYQQGKLVETAIAGGAKIVVLACSLNDAEDWGRGGELAARRPDTREPIPPAWAVPFVRHTATGRLIFDRLYREKRMRAYRRYYGFLFRPEYTGQKKLAEAVVEHQGLCRSNGVVLVGMLFPLLNQDLRPGHYEPYAGMHATMRAHFEAAGVPLLDLYPAFSGCDPVRLQNIPMLDPHPSEIAHRIAAVNLQQFLLERKLIPPAYAPKKLRDEHLIETWKKKLAAFGQPLE